MSHPTSNAIPPIPAGFTGELKEFVEQLLAIIARQADEIRELRDEVAVLKGHKSRPKFKGFNLDKKPDQANAQRARDDDDTGAGESRGTFAMLKKTCRKLDVSFWRFLVERVAEVGPVVPLSHLIGVRAAQLHA